MSDEHVTCDYCGDEVPELVIEDCPDCLAQCCPDCIDYHIDEEHTPKCAECDEPLEQDPPCPICEAKLCDDCFKEHFARCKFDSELGKQQRSIMEWIL